MSDNIINLADYRKPDPDAEAYARMAEALEVAQTMLEAGILDGLAIIAMVQEDEETPNLIMVQGPTENFRQDDMGTLLETAMETMASYDGD